MDNRKKFLSQNGDVGTPATNPDKCYREEEATVTASRSIYEENILYPVGRLFSDEIALKTRGKPLRIGTWNVRTLYKAGNLDKGIQEMKNMKLDIMGISETRWTESGKITTGNHTMIYSRGIEHTHRLGFILNKQVANTVIGYWPISERVLMVKLYGKPFNINIIQVYTPTQDHSNAKIEALYEEIKKALKYAKLGVVLCAMGDLAPKVGREAFKSIV